MSESEYGQLVAENKLFQQFDLLVGYEGLTETEVTQLKALVTTVADQIGPHLDRIRVTFGQYTEHDLRHSCNVAKLVCQFLPKRGGDSEQQSPKPIRLNALELAMLWLSILLHDVGMYVTDGEKQETLDSDDYKAYLRGRADRSQAVEKNRREGHELRARAIEDALLAEYYRRIHPGRARRYIEESLAKKVPLEFRQTSLVDDIARLCESHGWGVRESNDPAEPKQAVVHLERDWPVNSVRVNLRYLACCLRLGDVLDFDRSRTPLDVYEEIDFTEEKSIEEWNKHLSVAGWRVDEHRAMFRTECTHPAYYVAVHDFLNFVDDELRECRYLLDDAPAADVDRYALSLAHVVDRHLVRMKDPRYVAGGFRFQLEYDEIMRLLMDKSLYPDATLFLRELLQNSLDACRYQEALAAEDGMDDKYKPRITVHDHSDDPEQPRIVFEDNGVGMSQRLVEDFFLRVGKSYYRSPDFEAERRRLADKDIQLDACSQFGIGFLSCFLAGDHIEVETYRHGGTPLKITITGQTKYFLIERLPKPPTSTRFNSPADPDADGPPNYPGTRVTVHLRPGWHTPKEEPKRGVVHETLDTFAVNQEYDLRIIRPKRKRPLVIKRRRWDNAEPLPFARSLFYVGYDSGALLPHLAASPVPLHEWGLRGGAWLWMFDDEQGGVTPVRGALRVRCRGQHEMAIEPSSRLLRSIGQFNSITEEQSEKSELLSELRRHLDRDLDEVELVAQLREVFLAVTGEASEQSRLLGWLDEWVALPACDRSEVCSALERRSQIYWCGESQRCHHESWNLVPEIAALLLNANHNELYEAIDQQRACLSRLAISQAECHLALLGIDVPAGVLSWQPAKGNARQLKFLPFGATARIDARGTTACQPSAGRLFVPKENADNLLLTLGRAFICHAHQLFVEHSEEPQWQTWFREFASSCEHLQASALAEMERLHDYIEIWCEAEGEVIALTPKELLEHYGRYVPIAGEEGAEGVYERHWLLNGFPRRERKDGTTEIDLRDLEVALKRI